MKCVVLVILGSLLALFLTLCAVGVVTPAQAEILYIKPSLEVLMRKNQGDKARIVATVPMGTAVELLQGGKEWSRIRLQDGSDGWVRSRFLGTSPLIPVANIKPRLGLDGSANNPQENFRDIASDNERLRKELASCTTDRSTLADKYQTLTTDPNSAIHTKTHLGEALRKVEELRQKLVDAEIENTVLRKNQSIKWFFIGGLVVLAGWLIGRLSSNGRKKRASLIT